jgi:hypothetical protein
MNPKFNHISTTFVSGIRQKQHCGKPSLCVVETSTYPDKEVLVQTTVNNNEECG